MSFVALLAMAAAATGSARAQNSNVSWVLTPYGELQNGDTVVIVDKTSAKALPKSASSNSAPGAISVTLNSAKDTLTGTPGATLLWVVVRDGDNYKFRKPGDDNEYLYFTDADNGVRVGNDANKQFSFENGGTYNVPFLKNNATGRYFGLTSSNLWRSPSSNSSTSTIKNTVIGFYKKTVIIIPTYTVTFAEGTEDVGNWSITPAAAATTGVAEGTTVTISYTGSRKVKSVVATVVPDASPTVDLEATTTAWADGSNYAVPAGGLTFIDAVTVSGNVTLTLTDGETLTLNNGISIADGATLTVQGNGTMNVNGTNGSNGGYGIEGGTGGNGGVAISGNIIVQGGATVTATGGNGNDGGNGDEYGGNGGNGGNAFAGTLTYKGGTVTANGGSAGSGGSGEEEGGSSGSAGKAFANDVDFTQATGYSVTNGTSPIGSVLNQRMVVISGGTPIPTDD